MIVIGNGESRLEIDLQKIKDTKVGCNAIYRDITVRHLVCIDKRMVREVIQTGYNIKNKIYTSKRNFITHRLDNNIHPVPELPYKGSLRPDLVEHWGSGPYAVLVGTQKSKPDDPVKLVGFDFYSKDKLINNVYKDSLNYAKTSDRAVDPRYWIYQIGKIFEYYPDKHFVIYNTKDWVIPHQWKYSNISVDSISNI
jgi:hypothetical protein